MQEPKPYYKKIDRSFFEWGIIIPKEYEYDFLYGEVIPLGSSREIDIIFKKKKYRAKLYHVNRKTAAPVYQLRWDTDRGLTNSFRHEFIHSYVILKSQKELHGKKKFHDTEIKKFRSNLSGGQQEVVSIRPISTNSIQIEPFIQIHTEWNELFTRLADNNSFENIFSENNDYLIQKSTNWISVDDYYKHESELSVVYYLANTSKKLLYIGKADNFGSRVKPGRQHQEMPPDWDLFRYDIIKPEYVHLLERLEDHTIRSFASVLSNKNGFSTLGIGEYTLVNKKWKKI